MTLDTYLAGCSQERRELFSELTSMTRSLADSAVDLSEFVFVPGQPHPDWDDAAEVIWQAVEQLMLPNPASPDELPILWVGYHVADRLTKKRQAQGFLLTDRRLVVKDSVDLIFSKGHERQYALEGNSTSAAESAAALVASVMNDYDWDTAGDLVDQEDAEWIEELLAAAVTGTLQTLGRPDRTGPAPAATPSAPVVADLRGRVAELGLAADVKYPDDSKHAKHFAKLAKVIPLDAGERILASFSGGTLLGVYGLLLTDTNLRSRDLGEPAICTPRAEIDASSVQQSGDDPHKIIAAPGQVHDLPTHLDERRVAALTTLIREWAQGHIN